MCKRVTNPRARWLDKLRTWPSHRQRGYQLSGGSDG